MPSSDLSILGGVTVQNIQDSQCVDVFGMSFGTIADAHDSDAGVSLPPCLAIVF
jgi:hypothetical protein